MRNVTLLMLSLLLVLPTVAQEGDGGLHLVGYCQDRDQRLILTSYQALAWQCIDDTDQHHPIDLVAACQAQYGDERPYPWMGSPYDPYSIKCHATLSTGTMAELPAPPPLGGGLDLGLYCQYREVNYGILTVVDSNSADGYACVDQSDAAHGIDMQVACDWQYPWIATEAVSARNDPWSWSCEPLEPEE